MRVRGRVDGNHAAIVAALRRVGCNVLDLSRVGGGCPDLLVQSGVALVLLEVKTARGRQTADQLHFEALGWPVQVVRSIEEAFQAMGLQNEDQARCDDPQGLGRKTTRLSDG